MRLARVYDDPAPGEGLRVTLVTATKEIALSELPVLEQVLEER